MKKLMKLAAFAAAAATLLVACNKEKDTPAPVPTDGTVMKVTIPDALTKVSFTDQTASDAGMALAWEAGDAIRVISGSASESFAIKEGFSGHVAEFTGNAVSGSSFNVIYPGTFETLESALAHDYAGQTQTGNGSTAHLKYNAALVGVDTYEQVAFIPDWATTHGGTLYQNGVLKLVVTLPEGVAAVTRAALSAESEIFVTDNAGAKKALELAVALENVDVSADGGVLTAYMNIPAVEQAIPAGTTLAVNVTGVDGTEYTKAFEVAQDVKLQGGKLNTVRLTAEGPEILSDYFVTVAGAGDKTGVDWENAMGRDELVTLLRSGDAALLQDVSIHMAAGEYYLAETLDGNSLAVQFTDAAETVGFTIKGGYPANLTGRATTPRDPETNVTILSGNKEKGILTIVAGTLITFDGLTLTDGKATQGGAVVIQSGSAIFNDCVLKDNEATNGDQESIETEDALRYSPEMAAGGAILLTGENALCEFMGCKVQNNKAPNGLGGAIAVLDDNAILGIYEGTTFVGNTSYGAGGAIYTLSGFTIEGSSDAKVTFTANKSLSAGNQRANGGAIWLEEKTTSTVNYAVFSGNAAGQVSGSTVNYSNGGVISMKGVTSFLADNCEFFGNIGRNGGCLNLELGGASVCKFTNCYFHDNHLEEGTTGNFHGGAARISYGTAQFEKCVFKNNSAYNGSGVFHLNANKSARIECKDCEFEGNYCGNGRGGCVTVEYGSLYVENCNFKENHAKTDRGGVFYVDSNGVSLEAKNCTFTGNYINGSSPFGAVMRTQADCEAIYTDCLFDGNYSTNRGGIFGLNGKTRLKMNRCVVKNNHAASGGMIQGGGDVISYLNRVTFVDNYTTGSGGWGVAFHNGNNNTCLNNCTLYGNHCTNDNPGNNISLNSDGGWLIVNSTIVDDNVTALVRANSTRKVILCNNILINRKTADNMFVLKTADLLNDLGHNVMSYTAAPASPAIASSDMIGATDASLGGSYSEVWNATGKYGVYSWTNNLTGFSPAAQADVENAMKTGYPETDGTHTSITNIGLDFYNWLVEIGEITTDGRGVTRTAPWWPGAYQN